MLEINFNENLTVVLDHVADRTLCLGADSLTKVLRQRIQQGARK